MMETLTHFLEQAKGLSYFLIFLVAALESAAMFGLVVPGETIILFCSFLASRGTLDVRILLGVVACGAIVGDIAGYLLGRFLGRSWLIQRGVWARPLQNRLQQAETYFAEHGGKTIFVARFIGFLRAMAPFIAGASRMPFLPFLWFDIAGGILWTIAVVSVGYFLGESWKVAEHWIGRASIVVGAGLVFILLFAWLWRWAIRHEQEIRARWSAFLERRRVRFLGRQANRLGTFVLNRFSPRGYLGLRLTLGALLLVASAWVFGILAHGVLTGDLLAEIDKQVASWLQGQQVRGLRIFLRVFDVLSSIPLITGLGILAAAYLLWKRRAADLLGLVLMAPGSIWLSHLLQLAFRRLQPTAWYELVPFISGYAFPSSQTMLAASFYGFLALLVAARLRAWKWKVSIVLSTLLLVLFIAFARLYLGLRYLSEVLGGLTAGIAWLALCETAINTFYRRKLPPRKREEDEEQSQSLSPTPPGRSSSTISNQ